MIIPINIWPAHMINCFLIKGENGHVLVDTGLPESETKILKAIQNEGIDPQGIKLIVVTHCHVDHFGGAHELKNILNVPVLAHELDLEFYQKGLANIDTMKPTVAWARVFKRMVKDVQTNPFTPDLLMQGGEFSLSDWVDGVSVLHTPGHTPGSLSVILPNREAIIMDMMSAGIGLGGVLFHSRVKHPAFHDDLKALKHSFDRLLTRDIEKFYLGHGKAVTRKQVLKYIKQYLPD